MLVTVQLHSPELCWDLVHGRSAAVSALKLDRNTPASQASDAASEAEKALGHVKGQADMQA